MATCFIFFFFIVLFQWRREMEKREGVVEFQFRERKLLSMTILTTKKLNFHIKWYHIMSGVKI